MSNASANTLISALICNQVWKLRRHCKPNISGRAVGCFYDLTLPWRKRANRPCACCYHLRRFESFFPLVSANYSPRVKHFCLIIFISPCLFKVSDAKGTFPFPSFPAIKSPNRAILHTAAHKTFNVAGFRRHFREIRTSLIVNPVSSARIPILAKTNKLK